MKHQQPAHAEIPATPTQQQHSPASPLADNNSSGSKPHLIAVMKTHGTVVPAALQAVPNALQAVATGQALDSTVQAVQQTAGLAQEKIKQTVQQTRYPGFLRLSSNSFYSVVFLLSYCVVLLPVLLELV